jgi:hypothetical protein
VVDPQLHAHLSGRAGDIKIFAFPLLMSLHACMPPLEETLKVCAHTPALLRPSSCAIVAKNFRSLLRVWQVLLTSCVCARACVERGVAFILRPWHLPLLVQQLVQ